MIHMTGTDLNPFKKKHTTHTCFSSWGCGKTVSKFVDHFIPTFNKKHYPKNYTSVSSYLFLTWKPNTHRKGTASFSGNSHQIHHYFINTFLFLCQNLLGLVTLHFSFHWLPFIQMWMQETGNPSLCKFHWVPVQTVYFYISIVLHVEL